jgi:hypothetical protein
MSFKRMVLILLIFMNKTLDILFTEDIALQKNPDLAVSTKGVIRSSNSKDIQYNGQSQIVFSFVRVVLTVFSVELCRSLFVLLSFFFRPLYCLFFDLPCLLITLLVSSLKQYRHWETTGEISKHFCVTV